MSDNVVTVTVSGLPGVGKSAIYGEIVLAMEAIGVRVDHADPDAYQHEVNLRHGEWDGDLEMYRPRVMMVEKNTTQVTPVKNGEDYMD